jgi:plasmid segregation protein ParM
MNISIDAGKHTTKAITNTNRFSIRTKLEEQGTLITKDANTLAVEYDGKKYIFGDGAQATDYETSKTKSCHKIAIYVAIATLSGDGYEVSIVTGCPISQFRNKELRDEYAEYIRGGGNGRIKINGVDKRFAINNVLVLPESIGVVMENIPEFMNNLIGVIDIGGLNTNAAIYENLKPLPSNVFTINEGGQILNAKIRRALNTSLMTNYQDFEIPYLRMEGRVKSIVEEVTNNQMETILAQCRQYNWNLKALPIVFTGGGSLMLEKQIRQLDNARLSRNPVWDNVQGFLKLKEMYRE